MSISPQTLPDLANETSAIEVSRDLSFAFGRSAHDVMERYFLEDAEGARLSLKFRVYYFLRPLIPIMLRQLLQRKRNTGMDIDSEWYLPKAFIEDFRKSIHSDLDAFGDETFVHPWPNHNRFAAVLTHDVETSDGFATVDRLAKLEESKGFRSSWHFVPHKYPLDDGLLRDLVDRGHEVGIHGYNHDGRLFASRHVFNRRLPKINAALQKYCAAGFRAPMVHRNLDWIEKLDLDYDASCFDVDPFQAMPGGVGSIWPFLKGKMVELPYTLPQDHTLFVAMEEKSIDAWKTKINFLREWSGMALSITHPDYLDTPFRLGLYEQLLDHLQQFGDAWSALPCEVVSWWRDRSKSEVVDGQVSGPASVLGRPTTYAEMFGDLLD